MVGLCSTWKGLFLGLNFRKKSFSGSGDSWFWFIILLSVQIVNKWYWNLNSFFFSGSCNQRVNKWYYNYATQRCEEFVYTGCGGNSNNFPNYQSCQSRCMIGACCYRYPLFKNRVTGYNQKGYDRCALS